MSVLWPALMPRHVKLVWIESSQVEVLTYAHHCHEEPCLALLRDGLLVLPVPGRSRCCFSISPAAAAKSLQLCPTLCDPIDGSLPGSPIPGILQARTLEWVAISFSNAWKWKVKVKSHSRESEVAPTLSDPMDCSPPGSSICGIFQARVLEWSTIAFSVNSPTGS